MLESYRLCSCLVILTACGTTPPPPPAKPDPTRSASYVQAVQQLQTLNAQAAAAFKTGKSGQAAAIMEQEKPLISEVLAVPQPTLAATLAASDLDELYGNMLLANRHYGWARIKFQSDLARWRHWRPATPETAARLQLAQSNIAACDRHIEQ